MIYEPVISRKEATTEEIVVESSIRYKMFQGNDIINGKVEM